MKYNMWWRLIDDTEVYMQEFNDITLDDFHDIYGKETREIVEIHLVVSEEQ